MKRGVFSGAKYRQNTKCSQAVNKKSLTAAGPVPTCQAKKRGRTRSNTKNPGPAVGGKVNLRFYGYTAMMVGDYDDREHANVHARVAYCKR